MNKNKLRLYATSAFGATIISLSSAAIAGEATPANRFGLGLALHTGSTEYTDFDTASTNLFPVYRGDRINVDDGELGFNFLPDSAFDLEALMQRQHFGYESDDAKILEGMEDRHQVWGLGARFTANTEFGRIRTGIYYNPIDDKDVKTAESGSSAELEYGYPLSAGKLEITPVAGMRWISEDVTGFLYGVTPSEATASRAAFKGEDASIVYIGVEAEGMVTDSIRLTGGLRYESLPDEIVDSPLVDEDSVARAYLGVAWMF